jgi:hypothetical protein
LLVSEAGGAVRVWEERVGWRPLERFTAADPKKGLRAWSSPTLVGGAAIVPLVAADLAPRRALAAWRVLKRLTARGRGSRVAGEQGSVGDGAPAERPS